VLSRDSRRFCLTAARTVSENSNEFRHHKIIYSHEGLFGCTFIYLDPHVLECIVVEIKLNSTIIHLAHIDWGLPARPEEEERKLSNDYLLDLVLDSAMHEHGVIANKTKFKKNNAHAYILGTVCRTYRENKHCLWPCCFLVRTYDSYFWVKLACQKYSSRPKVSPKDILNFMFHIFISLSTPWIFFFYNSTHSNKLAISSREMNAVWSNANMTLAMSFTYTEIARHTG
jgi:hypothetical protein